MIRCEDSKVTIIGDREELISEVCFILNGFEESIIRKLGDKAAEQDMQFIISNYNKKGSEELCNFITEELAKRHTDSDGEGKQRICDLLLPVLQATHNLHNLISLQYDAGKECVIAVFPDGEKQANVALDSGTSMIRDIILQIV